MPQRARVGELKQRRILIFGISLGLFAQGIGAKHALGQRIIFVNAVATGADSGTSWKDAYRDLQDALEDARTVGGCRCDVWIAQGTYTPDRGTRDRTLGFELVDQVALYGGFAGCEDCLDERDPVAHESILSGDLNGNDGGQPEPTSSCCTITYLPGCDDAHCAEVANAHDLSRVTCETWWDGNCMSLAQKYCCDLCRPGRCDNSYNVVRAVAPGLRAILDGLTISGGEGANPNGNWDWTVQGGGIYGYQAELSIYRCVLRANAAWMGAALYLEGGSGNIANTIVAGNAAIGDYYSVLMSWDSDLAVEDCDLVANRAGAVGLAGYGAARIQRSRFLENARHSGGAAGVDLFFGAGAEIVDSDFIANQRGAVSNNDGFVTIDNSRFIGNRRGPAVSSCGGLTARNSVFVGNDAMDPGYYPYETPQSGFAGAVDNACGSAAFLNCTFVANHAGHIGGIWGGDATGLTNCILWDNSDDYSGFGELAQFNWHQERPVPINYNIIQGWTGALGGSGNSGNDPLLIDPDGPDDVLGTEDDNVRLSPGSPAFNAGRPTTSELPPTDLDGHARVLCGRVDIGAYEFGIGDFNCDQTIDLPDFANWSACMTGPDSGPYSTGCEALDSNADGDVDLHDFYTLQSVFAP